MGIFGIVMLVKWDFGKIKNIMKSKYIIFDNGTFEYPIVFSPLIEHDTVKSPGKAVAAGFCICELQCGAEIKSMKIVWDTWGKSISLDLKSRPEDSKILNNMLAYDI